MKLPSICQTSVCQIMTKCPPYCRLKTSFTYKLLVALKRLQSTKNFCNGVALEELAKFMEKNFCVTGDIRSQIENSIHIAEESRLVLKKKNGYIILTPAARLHNVPAPCVKARLEEIQKTFNHTVCEKEKTTTKLDFLSKKKKPERKNVYRSKAKMGMNTRSRTRSRSRSPRTNAMKNNNRCCNCEDSISNPCDVDIDSSDSSCD